MWVMGIVMSVTGMSRRRRLLRGGCRRRGGGPWMRMRSVSVSMVWVGMRNRRRIRRRIRVTRIAGIAAWVTGVAVWRRRIVRLGCIARLGSGLGPPGGGALGECHHQVAAVTAEKLAPGRGIGLGVVLLGAVQLLAGLHIRTRLLAEGLLLGTGRRQGSAERQAQAENQLGTHGVKGVGFELIDRWHHLLFLYSFSIRERNAIAPPELLPKTVTTH